MIKTTITEVELDESEVNEILRDYVVEKKGIALSYDAEVEVLMRLDPDGDEDDNYNGFTVIITETEAI